MTGETLAAELIGASRTGMHITLMAVVVVIAVVAFGVIRWRHRRETTEAAAAEQQSALHDLSAETKRPTDEL
jgi:flagellar basal body-associated protein FliL